MSTSTHFATSHAKCSCSEAYSTITPPHSSIHPYFPPPSSNEVCAALNDAPYGSLHLSLRKGREKLFVLYGIVGRFTRMGDEEKVHRLSHYQSLEVMEAYGLLSASLAHETKKEIVEK